MGKDIRVIQARPLVVGQDLCGRSVAAQRRVVLEHPGKDVLSGDVTLRIEFVRIEAR